jgi:putative hydrolase of the HAD superfamily
VLTILNYLKEKHIRTGIITDGYASCQRLKLESLNADKYFDFIGVTDELGEDFKKPNLKIFEKAGNFFKIALNEMIYVGDNPEKDFYISKDSDIKTIRIIREDGIYSQSKYKENIREFASIFSLRELEKIIESID